MRLLPKLFIKYKCVQRVADSLCWADVHQQVYTVSQMTEKLAGVIDHAPSALLDYRCDIAST